jgi:predicted DNA-binding transcriptional regulator AlpA
VRIIRLRHRQFLVRHQSHPRQVEGCLTLTQIAKRLDIAPHWIYDRINNGTIEVMKDPVRKLYVFPDEPATLEGFKRLVKGEIKKLCF